jgi:hypothetical protein
MALHHATRPRRAIPALLVAAALLYFLVTSLLAPPSAQSNPAYGTRADAVQAKPAHAFIDSIGVATHLHYNDTVYSRFDTLVRPRLLELGVRHVADAVYTSSSAGPNTFYYRRLRELGRTGIRFNLGVSMETPNTTRTDIDKLDDVQAWSGGAIELFEGANEPDIAGVADWAARARALQQGLWRKVQSDPALRDVDVIAPSPVFKPGALGDVSQWTDYGNWHAYPGGRCPACADVYGQSFDRKVGAYRAPAGGKPLMVTETGYHNATSGSGGHRAVSERAAGKYIPRLLFEYFNRGVKRSYLYELIDLRNAPSKRDANFGLLRNDGSRKPAFVALRNLIDILDDPGTAFTPARLDYRLSGHTANVRHRLLQKRDGTFYLALWQSRTSYDTGERANRADALDARGDLTVAGQSVTIATGRTFSDVRLYRPGRSTEPQQTWDSTATVTISVPDEVVLLELRHAATGTARDRPIDCDPDTPSPFADVGQDHPFVDEITCIANLGITGGVGSGRRFEPALPLLRWQMAVFIDRLAALGADARPTPVARGFRDIANLSVEARHAINRLHDQGVVNGTSKTTFGPFLRVTRGQIAAFLNRLAGGSGGPDGADFFTDDNGHPHEADINAVAARGIVRGSGDGTFKPNAAVTRGAMAAMLARYVTLRGR